MRPCSAAGADPLTTDSQTGATPLHKAAQGGSVEVAQLLVEAGAFVDAVTPTMGHTPIMDGLWYKWPAFVKYLVDQGANLHFSTHYGFSMMEHLQFELNVNTLGKDKLLEIDATVKQREQSRPGRHRQPKGDGSHQQWRHRGGAAPHR